MRKQINIKIKYKIILYIILYMNLMLYEQKYLKYKSKYLQLKKQIAGTLSLVTLNAVRTLLTANPEPPSLINDLRTIYRNAQVEDKLDLDETAGFVLFDLGLGYGTFEELLNHGLDVNSKQEFNDLLNVDAETDVEN